MSASGQPANYAGSWLTISGTGRFVVFSSLSTNLVPGDTNGFQDAFLRDTLMNTIEIVSLGHTGAQGNSASSGPSVTDDGRFIAFQSLATNLVPGVTNGKLYIYLRDRQLGRTSLVSVTALGTLPSDHVGNPVISPDGRYVGFATAAPGMVPQDTDTIYDLFVHDTWTRKNRLINVGAMGKANDFSSSLSFTPDLKRLVFSSLANNLVPGDTVGEDVFLRDMTIFAPQISYCTSKVSSGGCAPRIGVSGIPTVTGADVYFVTASQVDGQQQGLLFWGPTAQSTPFAGGLACVGGPRIRTPVQLAGGVSGTCDGDFSFPFDQAYMAAHGLGPGTTIFGQWWTMDSGSTPPVGLSDGLKFTIAP